MAKIHPEKKGNRGRKVSSQSPLSTRLTPLGVHQLSSWPCPQQGRLGRGGGGDARTSASQRPEGSPWNRERWGKDRGPQNTDSPARSQREGGSGGYGKRVRMCAQAQM